MRLLLLLAAGLTLAACDATAPDPVADVHTASAAADARASQIGPDLAAVRRATARYHRVDRAVADRWGDPVISECVAHPELGGMGHHYVNLGVLLDGGALDPSAPEALLYEPTSNGRFRLVGVEYIVPVAQDAEGNWVSPGDAPELFGQKFHLSEGAGGWALHVWVWKNNPSGMFADFNPTVSCDYAQVP